MRAALGRVENRGGGVPPSAADHGWEPCGAATGLGSVPMADPIEAVRFVAEHSPTVPFWPQPPTDDLITAVGEQLGRAVTGRTWASAIDFERNLGALPVDLDQRLGRNFEVFLAAGRAGAFPSARAVKGQLNGPFTLAWFLHLNGCSALERPRALAALAERVAAQAIAQVERLSSLGQPVLLFIDEPVLGLIDASLNPDTVVGVLGEVVAAVRSAGALVGVHCCTCPSASLLIRTGADIVSVDAVNSCDVGADQAGQRFWEDGGTLAMGAVAANGSGLCGDAFAVWSAAASRQRDPAATARRTIITSTCGHGMLAPAEARRAAQVLRRTESLVRAVAAGSVDAPWAVAV